VILKIKDGRGGHLKKLKNRNISALDRPVLNKNWQYDVSHSTQPKFYAFSNLSCWPIAIWKI